MTANPKPVVTMDVYERLKIDRVTGPVAVGYVRADRTPPLLAPGMGLLSAADLRAIADFLDQIEGADLLSSVEAG